MTARRVQPSLVELRARWTLTIAEVGRLLGVSDESLYHKLVYGDGTPVRWTQADPDRDVYLSWLGRLIPTHRDHNGHLMFVVAEADQVLGAGRLQAASP